MGIQPVIKQYKLTDSYKVKTMVLVQKSLRSHLYTHPNYVNIGLRYNNNMQTHPRVQLEQTAPT